MTKPLAYSRGSENGIKKLKSQTTDLNDPPSPKSHLGFKENGITNQLPYAGALPKAVIENRFQEIPKSGGRKGGYWSIKENRIRETVLFVEELGKPIQEIKNYDFRNNGMNTLICKTKGYRRALREAEFDISITGWTTVRPNNYWKPHEVRVAAVRNLVKGLNKPVTEVTSQDFKKAGLGGMLMTYYRSPYLALREAGYNIEPWEMKVYPTTIWKISSNRRRAVEWLSKELNKRPEDLKYLDFKRNGLKGLIRVGGGVARTLRETGYKVRDRMKPANYWKNRINRVKHIIRAVKRIGKPPQELVYHDFREMGLGRLIDKYYGGSTRRALEDAGFELPFELTQRMLRRGSRKTYVSNHGHRFISVFERDLDNWLYDKGVIHHRHDVRYPDSKKKCDFVVGKFWIEAAGLLRFDFYDEKMKIKNELAQRHGLKLIVISLCDFYRKRVLERKLSEVLKDHGTVYNRDLAEFGRSKASGQRGVEEDH